MVEADAGRPLKLSASSVRTSSHMVTAGLLKGWRIVRAYCTGTILANCVKWNASWSIRDALNACP